MNLGQVFDTLNYGKGTARRGDYYFYVSVESKNKYYNLGFKKKELKVKFYYLTFKGETVLVFKEEDFGKRFETSIVYDGSNVHNFNKSINKTLKRVKIYMLEPFSKYKKLYNENYIG